MTAVYINTGQVAIDGDIAAVTYHDDHGAAEAEDTADLTIEDAASLGAALTFNINALIVQCDVMQALYVILSKMANDAVGASDRHGQTAAVALEVATDTDIL